MDLKNFVIKADGDYPQIVGATKSPKTVAIVKNLMSGNNGELLAILQYFYQSSISKDLDKEISNILEEISIVDMMHLELLSHAIVDFGGEPKYENTQGVPFVASNINYTTKLREMLDTNIISKERVIEGYTNAINQVDNNSLKQLFKRIIEDEKLHIKVFKHLRDNVKFLSY